MQSIRIGNTTFDKNSSPLLIAGPCVIEGEDDTLHIAERIRALPICEKFTLVFKASYSKDNRTASSSYRGPGLSEGLRILEKVRQVTGCPILSDVHTEDQVRTAAEVLDIVQIPAFLSRQTSLLEAAGKHARAVNIKKGQFLTAEGAGLAAEKVRAVGGSNVLLTERGTSFGYNDLVVDFRSIPKMQETGCPVIFDVTHSLQKPAGLGDRSGGEPELAGVMARAAAAIPCDGLFIETHVEPSRAKSDGASMLPFAKLEELLTQVHRIFEVSVQRAQGQAAPERLKSK